MHGETVKNTHCLRHLNNLIKMSTKHLKCFYNNVTEKYTPEVLAKRLKLKECSLTNEF